MGMAGGNIGNDIKDGMGMICGMTLGIMLGMTRG